MTNETGGDSKINNFESEIKPIVFTRKEFKSFENSARDEYYEDALRLAAERGIKFSEKGEKKEIPVIVDGDKRVLKVYSDAFESTDQPSDVDNDEIRNWLTQEDESMRRAA